MLGEKGLMIKIIVVSLSKYWDSYFTEDRGTQKLVEIVTGEESETSNEMKKKCDKKVCKFHRGGGIV